MNRLTDVVKNLIIINVIIFIGIQTLPSVIRPYGELANLYYFQSDKFYPFQIVTSMFMHADFMHLIFNMLGLFFIGPMVENTLGSKKFFILYILAGLVASIVQIVVHHIQFIGFAESLGAEELTLLMTEGMAAIDNGENFTNPRLSVLNRDLYMIMNFGVRGASGAVYGVLLGFVAMFPNMKLTLFPIPIQIPAFAIGIVVVGMALYNGIFNLQPGIGHFAHLGGAITGYLLIHYWKMANLR